MTKGFTEEQERIVEALKGKHPFLVALLLAEIDRRKGEQGHALAGASDSGTDSGAGAGDGKDTSTVVGRIDAFTDSVLNKLDVKR